MKTKKHIDLNDRCRIMQGLCAKKTIRQIARTLGRSPSTISKEIQLNRVESTQINGSCIINDCKYYNQCKKRNNCNIGGCRRFCRTCGASCHDGRCPNFKKAECDRRDKAPFCCNGCKRIGSCHWTKVKYDAIKAHEASRKRLKDSRRGLNITTGDFKGVGEILLKGLNKGQAIHHICMANRESLCVSERSCYRYINSGLMSAKRHHLPMPGLLRKRNGASKETKVLRNCTVGRTYDEFIKYIDEHPGVPVVEMDTVIGNVDSKKVLLTFQFVQTGFMVARLLPRKSARDVNRAIDAIYEGIGKEDFKRLFKVILTDNGTEFSNPIGIEMAPDASERTKVFYAKPYRATDKPHVERNHEFIRRIVEKGESFDKLKQRDINLMMSHINSYLRPSNDKTPYERFQFEYGEEVLNKLGIVKIEPNDIILKPWLFR